MRSVVLGLTLALGVGTLVSAPAQAATPTISVATATATTSESGVVAVTLRCKASSTCTGSLALRLDGKDTASRAYRVAKKATTTYQVRLSAAQVASVPQGGARTATAVVRETKPLKRSWTTKLVVKRAVVPDPEPTPGPTDPTPTPEPTPEGPVESKAYRERNWTPTAYDTCPASLHKKHSVVGPDGKLYPTWHAPTDVDPATGKTCTYGHEHGDDPASSDLYTWVTDFLDADASKSRGIPFGYVSEALDTYASTRDNVTRHEDNVGHKVIVANDVKLVAASPRGYVRDANGDVVTCDFLMKVHQGSHSGDALMNNAHELLYAARCTDGTEIISSTLTRFGDANEFERSCDPSTTVTTSGSNLPDGFGGARLIPDRFCVDRDVLVPSGRSSSVWALYEVWQSTNRIATEDGTVLASFDPWFAVRNPARAHAGGLQAMILDLVDTTWMIDAVDDGRAQGYPWDEAAEQHAASGHEGHIAKQDPTSPFDGAQRDFYLEASDVDNAGGATTWWTDPYGENAVATKAAGLVRQHVSSTSNASWPTLERRQFDLEKDYGHENGVHAPN